MLGTARVPQLGGARGERARSKSNTDGFEPFRPNSGGVDAEMARTGVTQENAAGKNYTVTSYTAYPL